MSGVGSSAGPGADRPEQLIGALVPPAVRRCAPPVALQVPALPGLGLPVEPGEPLLLDAARLDGSGRFCSRGLLGALGWSPGHRIELRVGRDAVVIGSCAAGRHAVGSRGELTVPTSARTLMGLPAQARVVLVAAPARDLLIVHSAELIGGLLAEHYRRQAEIHDDG